MPNIPKRRLEEMAVKRRPFASRCFLLLLVAVFMSLSIPSCKQLSGTGETKNLPSPATDIDERLLSANTEFALGLYKQIAQRDRAENICVSPASIWLALSMTYNGADGDTHRAMAKVLGIKGMSLDQINGANADLMSILVNPDPKVELTLANSVWMRKGVNLKEEFAKRNEETYRAETRTLNFDAPDAPKTINDWVRKNTKGKIEKIVGEKIDERAVMFLINAIYFKGTWTDEFNPNQTKNLPF